MRRAYLELFCHYEASSCPSPSKPPWSSPECSLENYRFAYSLPLLIRECPNTLASFSLSFGDDPLPPSTANVLRASGIAKLLKAYPNQRFVDTLTSIAISGARVGFQGE